MPNPQIPMAIQPFDTATGVYNAQQQANSNMQQGNQNQQQMNNNALSAERVLKEHYEALDVREKSRLSSTIAGAVQLKQFIDKGDLEGADRFLQQRKTMLQQRIGGGENIDTQETDFAINALRTGNLQELRNGIDGLVAAGQVYGILGSTGNPYLDQFREVKKAHPEWTDAQVQDYVYTRGQVNKTSTFDVNGNIVNPQGAVSSIAERAGAEKFAAEQGGAAGKQVIANNTILNNLGTLRQAVTSAKLQLQKVSMTGPIFGRAADAAKDVEYINLQRDINEITLLAKDLYNLGSGAGFTDADRNFLQELAGGKYNREDSIAYALDRFEQTLANREATLQNQNQNYQQQYGAGTNQQGQQTVGVTSTGNKIRVSNGRETFMIDATDLPAALQEGFQQQ